MEKSAAKNTVCLAKSYKVITKGCNVWGYVFYESIEAGKASIAFYIFGIGIYNKDFHISLFKEIIVLDYIKYCGKVFKVG